MTAVTDFTPVLAHQYGWDEIVIFLVPIGLAVAGVRYAESRAKKKRLAQETSGEPSDE